MSGERVVTVIDGEEVTVDLVAIDGDMVTARLEAADGAMREISFERLSVTGSGTLLRMADGGIVSFGRRETGRGHYSMSVGDAEVAVHALSERDAWLGVGMDDGGGGAVSVSMPGRVVKLLVGLGDVVAKGQPVLIIEAMKMENEVKAAREGSVAAVHVAEGESVEADVVLMEISDG